MLSKHRAKIDQYIDQLVSNINIRDFWPKLFEYKIYNHNDVNIPKWEPNLEEPTTIKDIILTIKTRGPEAFSNLLRILREMNHVTLANLLASISPSSSPSTHARHEDADKFLDKCKNIYDPSKAGSQLEIKVRKSQKFHTMTGEHALGQYPMRSNPRGVVLLISLIDYLQSDLAPRTAGQHDEANIIELYSQMGYLVQPHRNLTNAEIRKVLRNFIKQDILRQVDSCFVIICGHGSIRNKESVILGVDSLSMNLDHGVSYSEVVNYFSASKCPNLINKPKVFVFATCRGDIYQPTVKNGSVPNINEQFHMDNESLYELVKFRGVTESVRAFSDILIATTTLSGHVAFRDNTCGTWYLQILCDVFMKHACDRPVTELFRMIDSRLKDMRAEKPESGAMCCQTSTIKLIGFTEMYINPGLFE